MVRQRRRPWLGERGVNHPAKTKTKPKPLGRARSEPSRNPECWATLLALSADGSAGPDGRSGAGGRPRPGAPARRCRSASPRPEPPARPSLATKGRWSTARNRGAGNRAPAALSRRPRSPAVSDLRRGEGVAAVAPDVETSASGVQRAAQIDRSDGVPRARVSSRPVPAGRSGTGRPGLDALQKCKWPQFFGAGRRLVAPGLGSLTTAEHPGSDGPPQGASTLPGHPSPPAAGSRAGPELPRTSSGELRAT